MKILTLLSQRSAGLLIAVIAASTLSCAGEMDKPGADKPSTDKTSTPAVTADAPHWSLTADGFASVNDLGQNGTTGGADGKTVTVDNLADLEKYAKANEPYIILIKGTIAKEPFGKPIYITSNKTLVGLGADATILHGELQMRSASNVIVRNLTIRDSWVEPAPGTKGPDYDGFQIDDSHHIWIDHCRITHMSDGLIDFRKESDYLTVSWCELSRENKAFGVGWSDSVGKRHVTIHHTWIHDTNQRNPSLGDGTGHLYNNYLQDITSYGNYSRGKSKVVVENSVFEKVKNPLQRDAEAELVSRGNILKDCTVADDQKSPDKGEAFDPRQFYPYSLDAAKNVPDLLKNYAGPQESIGSLYMTDAHQAGGTANGGN
jgi:pectate lyase